MFTCTHWNTYAHSHWFWIYRRRALQGRYSCLAQGASPGLGIDIHFLSPQRGRHFQDIRQMRAPKVPLLRSSYFFVHVYPGFCSCLWHSRHPGLCRSVVPTALLISLNVDNNAASAAQCNGLKKKGLSPSIGNNPFNHFIDFCCYFCPSGRSITSM